MSHVTDERCEVAAGCICQDHELGDCVGRRELNSVGKTGASNARSSRELVLEYLRNQVDELRVREPGARTDSPDAVHRMRVASRRLRSSLATFRPLFAGSQAQHLRDELLWLGAVLGPVRDVEVMRDHLHRKAVDAVLKSGVIALYYRCKEQPSPAPTRGTLHGRGADGGGREGSGARESSLGLIREVGRVATS